MADAPSQSDETFLPLSDFHMHQAMGSTGIAFCVSCQEYLCADGLRDHLKNKASRDHQIIQGDDLNKVPPTASSALLFEFCDTHKTSRVEFYCTEHDSVFCESCKSLSHNECETKEIERVCSELRGSDTAAECLVRIKALLSNLKTARNEIRTDKNNLLMQKKNVIKEIEKLRADITELLNRLQDVVTRELEDAMQKETEHVTDHVTRLETAIQKLETDVENLESAQTRDNNYNVFVAMKKVDEDKMKHVLQETSEERYQTTLEFEPDSVVSSLLSSLQSLGGLKVRTTEGTNTTEDNTADEGQGAFFPEEVRDKKLAKISQLNVRETQDKQTCWIRGSVFLPSGNLLLSDMHNENLKLVDIDSRTQTSLQLPGWPWDVALVDDEEAVVTMCNIHCLQFVTMDPDMKLKLGRVVDVRRRCYGVAVSEEKLFVSCHNRPGQGEVLELNLQGTVLRSIRGAEDGAYGFTSPVYIAVNSQADRLFVSDFQEKSVTSMRMDGTVVYKFKGQEIKTPFKLLVDTGDNVYVCDRDLQRVLVLTKKGRKHGVFLSEKLEEPFTLAYRGHDHALVIGGMASDVLQVYRFTDDQNTTRMMKDHMTTN